MIETFDTEKPKNKGIPSRYNQNHALLFMIFAFGSVTFFNLDELIGAVGIQPIEWWGRLLSAYLLIALNIYLFRSSINIRLSFHSIVFLLPVWLILWFVLTCVLIIISSWIVIEVLPFLPITIFPLLLLLSALGWLVDKYQLFSLSKKIVVRSVWFTTILCLLFLFSYFKDLYRFYRIDRVETHIEDHHYFMDIETVFPTFDFASYWLVLYECNSIAINCQEIYRSEDIQDSHVDKPKLQNSGNTIQVRVGDEIWFERETK